MGLCKCPKKKVSNLFCFDHRVTVCESCLVLNHRKCVIKSYLMWLKDSDFDPLCTLCGTNLEEQDCVRLICLDVFHSQCLNERMESLPSNTAPTGRGCPICNTCIFPNSNLVSPVADNLRIFLSQTNWGRTELNLPFNEEEVFSPKSITQTQDVPSVSSFNDVAYRTNVPERTFEHSILNIESRPLIREAPIGRSSDRDDNKYKRKTPQEIFSRWSRQFYSPARPPKRKSVMALVGVFLFASVIYLMYHFGRAEDSSEVHYDE